jgi:hypothetical protein
MQVKRLLQNLLLIVIHKKRAETLVSLILALLNTKTLSLTKLGRAFSQTITQRSGIRIVDRFLGNKKLMNELDTIQEAFVRYVIGFRIKLQIIVDWTNIPNTNSHAIRAALVANGRAITIMEDVYPERKLGNKKVHNRFLERLKKMIPAGCEVCIITDGGFHNDWFRKVLFLGWDYIGRIRLGSGYKYYDQTTSKWKTLNDISSGATTTPKFIGFVKIGKGNPFQTYLYIYKGDKKGRKSLNRAGKKRKDTHSLEYRKAALEPWILTSSIKPESKYTANRVVEKYSKRMQIEEGIRDLKSTKYGFGFEHCLSKKIERIKILLMIARIAAYFAFIVGFVSEKNKLHYDYQSSSLKTARILSLFYLGCEIIKDKIKISIDLLRRAMTEEYSDHS